MMDPILSQKSSENTVTVKINEVRLEMHNVDTMSLTMNFRRKNETGEIDWNYIYKIQSKIMKKLVMYKKDKQNREREIRYNNLSRDSKFLLNRLLPVDTKRKKRPIYWHR